MCYLNFRIYMDNFHRVFDIPLLITFGESDTLSRHKLRVTPIADLHCVFNVLFGTTITYKAFEHQFAKPHFADFARTMTERLMSEMTLKVLGFEKGRALSEFRHIVIQDGSSFAIHDGLREVFPGRFKTVKPAAVELHTTMDLLCDAPTTAV